MLRAPLRSTLTRCTCLHMVSGGAMCILPQLAYKVVVGHASGVPMRELNSSGGCYCLAENFTVLPR